MTRVFGLLGLLAVALSVPAFAQAPPAAKLVLTVVDETGAVIPAAVVRMSGADATTKGVTVPEAKTIDKGTATFDGLKPGRYDIQAEFPGFEVGTLKDVRIRPGDNKHVVILRIQKVETEVTVGRDAQTAGSDRRATFGTAMTREQIESLSDDPDEMAKQLEDMAGPGAVLRIDSFEGGKLPPKAQIKAIHITRDAFAAENHFAGGLFVDIITQPGLGPLRGGGNYRGGGAPFNARNPMTATKADEQTQGFGFNIGGSLIKDRSSFSFSTNINTQYSQPHLKIGTGAGGERSENLNIRVPRDGLFMYGLFDYALTKDQTLRVNFYNEGSKSRNLGVGGFDLEDRAYSNDDNNFNLRIQEAGPLGRRMFTNTRLEFNRSTSSSTSVVEAQTIRINGWRTFGGQQQSGGRRYDTLNLASDLDYVRGIHSVRTGIVLNGGRYSSDESANYIGTYTFESEADFDAGRPRNFTRRIGDPHILYWNLQAAFYVQDDVRISKSLTLSPGLRYETQTHLNDLLNLGPRFGITWAPFKNGKTTLRASFGVFYDWLAASIYEQTLRVDGRRQQELNIPFPSYPDPGNIGIVSASNRYLLDGDMGMVRNVRLSLGVDHRLNQRVRFGATYSDTRSTGVLRGHNLNSPVNGIRPDPEFNNVVEVVPDGRLDTRTLSTNFGINIVPPTPAMQKQRFNWRRGGFNGGYTLTRARNNSDGPFSLPATGDLLNEWGPASSDVRHRLNAGINSQWLRNLNVFVNINAQSAPPYTIRTGRDDNGDQVFNDRPAGIGRNSARGSGQFWVQGNFNYTVPIGKKKVAAPPGIMIRQEGMGSFSVMQAPVQDTPKFRLNFTVNVQNMINRTNYISYDGTLTSLFYGHPTTAGAPRKVMFGMGFNF